MPLNPFHPGFQVEIFVEMEMAWTAHHLMHAKIMENVSKYAILVLKIGSSTLI